MTTPSPGMSDTHYHPKAITTSKAIAVRVVVQFPDGGAIKTFDSRAGLRAWLSARPEAVLYKAALYRSGLFVRLQETGADGFIPASSIIGDFYRLDERLQALIGDDTGLTFQLGDTVEVRLVEAITSAGALRFEMLSDGRTAPTSARRGSPRARRVDTARAPG